ncbi:MAG: sulfotransferase family protein [Rhodanobacteraceae bacterium]|jgi:hypothetical protein
MTAPNFILAGAPKCGTTALATYLRQHPRIFMCMPKEPGYFAADLPEHRYVSTWKDYTALFSGATGEHRAVGEASIFYMYSDSAIAEIRRTLPDAKLIVMLRNPVDLAISMHSQALRSRDEDVVDFADAWTLCADRRAGRKTPLRGRDHKILLYDTLPLLGQQLQRLLQTFPETQVRWWFYDDFASDPAQIYREVLAFLDVEHDGRDAFPLVNPRRHARSQSLAQFTQKTPKPLVRAAMYAKRRIGIQRLGLLDALRSVNFVRGKQAIAPALMEEMRVHFTPDIRLLESITGRSLAHWRGAAA